MHRKNACGGWEGTHRAKDEADLKDDLTPEKPKQFWRQDLIELESRQGRQSQQRYSVASDPGSRKCSLFIGSEKSLNIVKERSVTVLFSPLADEQSLGSSRLSVRDPANK